MDNQGWSYRICSGQVDISSKEHSWQWNIYLWGREAEYSYIEGTHTVCKTHSVACSLSTGAGVCPSGKF